MLIEEIERLHIDLWTAKAAQEHQVAEQADADVQVYEGTGRSFRVRLTGILGRE
jgi:tRNA(Met) C34 N-acetyltransferase TmcA